MVNSYMTNFMNILLPIHITFGAAALLSFWIPLVAKKGGRLHIKSGWFYVGSMIGVALSAYMMGAWRIFFDTQENPSRKAFAAFLIMIATFSLSAIWNGVRVLKFKKRSEKHLETIDFIVCWLTILSSIIISIYGFYLKNTLVSWFPVLPLVLGIMALRYWHSKQTESMHWWFHHMRSMFTACIATITAFIVTAAPRLIGTAGQNVILWFTPTMILLPILFISINHYKKKFALIKQKKGNSKS